MPFTVQENKKYEASIETVYNAAVAAVTGLEGKFQKQEKTQYLIEANFNKTVLGKVLGDRAWVQLQLREIAEGGTELTLTAHPLNAIGQKLLFGARKGALRTLLTWLYAHLDHHLAKATEQ